MGKRLNSSEFRSLLAKYSQQDQDKIFQLLAQRVFGEPPIYEYPWLAKELSRFAALLTKYRLGIVSTFTLEPIRDVLRATALAHGLHLDIYFGSFQQLEQEVLSTESGLARCKPQGIVFAWALQDLSPTLWQSALDMTKDDIRVEITNVNNRLVALVEAARSNFPKVQLLLHTFVPPTYPVLGAIDFGHPCGHHQFVYDLNSGLKELTRKFESVHLVDCEGLARRAGQEWFNARYWYTARAKLGPKGLVVLACEYVKYIRALAGKSKKVLVTDLDNTLWGGILGEDGISGIGIGPDYPGNAFVAFQHEVKQLAKRGVVLAIASKNNESDVREAFAKHEYMVLKWADFAATRVNWQDKAANMLELAQELSLGLDSFVFIDDNPYELEMVQQTLPEVTTVQVPREPGELPGLLSRFGFFDNIVYTDEDRERGQYYRSQVQRVQLKRSIVNLDSFYRSLEMRLTVYDVAEAQIPRVAQLTQRTNQFNMTTHRYSESDIKEFLEDTAYLVRAYRLEDHFGDNGIISVVIVKTEDHSWYLDTFLMSCRVISRTVETAILALLAQEAHEADATLLVADFLPTKKNAPAKKVYRQHGFKEIEKDSDHVRYELDVGKTDLCIPAWFAVTENLNKI